MSRHTSARSILTLALTIVLAGGCDADDHGRLAAADVGGVIEPRSERIRRRDPFVAQCGERSTRRGALSRSPYLQSVTGSSATVVWTSSASAAQRVEVRGPDGTALGPVAPRATATRYLRVGRQYEARIEGLSPSTVYCYSIVDDAGVVRGPVGLRTAPSPGASVPVDVLAFGDSGSGSPDQRTLRRQMDTVPADLIVHTGDIAHPSGTLPQFEEFTFQIYEDLFDSIPFFPSPGNHDYETDEGGPYREVFVLPENGTSEGSERYYSFDWGPVHFAALDTNANSSAQAQWLDRDLARSEAPWKVVFAHHPPYSSGPHGSNAEFRELYLPAIRRHGVSLVLSGHDHHYERSRPIGGTTYLVTGGGGVSTRAPRARDHAAFAAEVLHFVHLRIEADELRGYAIDARGREFDAFRIAR